MIEGVLVKPLRQILDERGKIMHMIRNDDPDFISFGEIYFSCVYPGVIKGWHLHKKMTLNYSETISDSDFEQLKSGCETSMARATMARNSRVDD